ncbi:Pectinesterase [Macleaya cordata]|uniref:pectinesterase n=1 Tax=Macleaya cordata TaxID=56857 RepID=A0A200Q992_MACCD|nr:Pectinesterase [Macleaya cordata]
MKINHGYYVLSSFFTTTAIILLAFDSYFYLIFSSADSILPSDLSIAALIRVDPSGNGDYTNIQDAIDAVPSNNSEFVFIWLKEGTYREKILVPADKPFITLSGSNANTTIITWDDGGDIFQSPTFTVLASHFVGRYLTIQNTFGPSRKAVALRVSGDRAAFYGCRILSYQDSLLDDAGMHYYRDCYIEGGTDFICGNAASLFEKCHLHSLAKGTGAITAQRRGSAEENTGYTFLGCSITGVGTALLGRAWGAYSRVVFALTYMPDHVILPAGWDDWGDPAKQSTVYYGQYNCYGGGANVTGRVGWSHILSDEEAAPFLSKSMIGGRDWLRSIPTRFKKLIPNPPNSSSPASPPPPATVTINAKRL